MIKLHKKKRKDKDEDVWHSLSLLLIAIISVMTPIIYQIVIALINWDISKCRIIDEFLAGNVYLYSISLLMPIVYVVRCIIRQEYFEKKVKLPFEEAYIVTILAVCCYCISKSENSEINTVVTIVISTGIFIWAITIAYRINVFEAANKKLPDEVRSQNEKSIKDKLEKIEDGEDISSNKEKGEKGELIIDFDDMEDFE